MVPCSILIANTRRRQEYSKGPEYLLKKMEHTAVYICTCVCTRTLCAAATLYDTCIIRVPTYPSGM